MSHYCYCGGGDRHAWRPYGGGARILACPSDEPEPAPVRSRDECAACEGDPEAHDMHVCDLARVSGSGNPQT